MIFRPPQVGQVIRPVPSHRGQATSPVPRQDGQVYHPRPPQRRQVTLPLPRQVPHVPAHPVPPQDEHRFDSVTQYGTLTVLYSVRYRTIASPLLSKPAW